MKIKFTLIIIPVFLFCSIATFSQRQLFTNEDNLKYFEANGEPDANWYMPDYDDSSWKSDTAIVGFGFGNEGYTVIDSESKSLYVRFPFYIENLENIQEMNMMFDYDDGYIAYINGYEVARVNVDQKVEFPAYDAHATRSHAPELVIGLTSPVLGVYLDKSVLGQCLVQGENCMAVHVLNDSVADDLMLIPNLFDLTGSSFNIWDLLVRYKRLVPVDSTNLPLVVVETDQYGIAYDQSIWTTASMGIVQNDEGNYNKPGDAFNIYNGLISIRQRGQSSRDFAKKSYRFELVDSLGEDSTVSLFGMPEESDWIFFGPYTDKSQIRNKMVYDLVLGMGLYAPRSRFVELMLNGQNEGLYMITEQIKRDKNRVDISKLKDTDIAGYKVTGGYIFKFDKTDPNMKWRTNRREIVYPDELQDEQKAYLKNLFTEYDSIVFTNDFDDPEIGIRKYIDDTSLVDFIIANEFPKNADAYLYSTYMYKDRDDKDGRIKFGPVWDHDLSFGNTHFQEGNLVEGWQFDYNHATMKLRRLLQDRDLVQLLQERWWMYREDALSNETILGYMDELVEQVCEVLERNYEIWPIIDKELFGPGYYVNSYENEIAYMRNWIEQRLAWIDDNIDDIYYEKEYVGNDYLSNKSGDELLQVFPNPFTDNLKFRLYLEKECDVRIEFYNLYGQLQYSEIKSSMAGSVEIACGDEGLEVLIPGFYLVQIFSDNRLIKCVKLSKIA
ncbi:MAG: CotH kinase family protein [Prolixibacteraceae bacterium]|nr:CotH kinase family protein [Prolixibacteraceae bacterium]